jgi:septal ring factor EnvC (AmiA/AmiB activator)
MTPEQHYAEAERLLGRAMLDDWQPDNDALALAAVAHAHAALAAPTAGKPATVEPDHRRAAEHYMAQARLAELEQAATRLRNERDGLKDAAAALEHQLDDAEVRENGLRDTLSNAESEADDLRAHRDRARETAVALEQENGRLLDAGRQVVDTYAGPRLGAAVGRLSRVLGSSYHSRMASLVEQVPETKEPRLCGCGLHGEHDESHERVAELEARTAQAEARLRDLGEPVTLRDLPEAVGDGDEALS